MADNATASADCCVRGATVIKGLRIRKAQEMLLFFVFYENAFYFQLSGERNEEKHKKTVLQLVSKNTNQVFCSLVFAQVSSGSGVRKEREFCEQA